MTPRKSQQAESPAAAIDAQVAASCIEIQTAMRSYKQFWAKLSDADRAKLNKVSKLVKKFADRRAPRSETEEDLLIEKAVKEAQVDKELFERWWTLLMPVLTKRATFDFAVRVMWSKLAPGMLRNDPLGVAKLAAKNLKVTADYIYKEALRGNQRFFIELGKCLSGEIKGESFNDKDYQIIRILSVNPSISAKWAVRKLRTKGVHMTEEHFRVAKARLKGAIEAARAEYDQAVNEAAWWNTTHEQP